MTETWLSVYSRCEYSSIRGFAASAGVWWSANETEISTTNRPVTPAKEFSISL